VITASIWIAGSFVVFLICRRLTGGPSWRNFLILFGLGVGMGALMDLVCGYYLDWYFYTHHKWFSLDYFYLLYPCWGMNMILTTCTYNIVHRFIKPLVWRIAFMMCLALAEEVFGLVRGSWIYNLNPILVTTGWMGFFILAMLIKEYISRINLSLYRERNNANLHG
jgi:hypothetical protein